LLGNPGGHQDALDQNWRRLQRTASSSREDMAKLPHWERSALQNSLTAGTPQALDQTIGKSAVKQAADDELRDFWNGGEPTTPNNDFGMASDAERWNKATDDDEEQQPINQNNQTQDPESESLDNDGEEAPTPSEQADEPEGETPTETPAEPGSASETEGISPGMSGSSPSTGASEAAAAIPEAATAAGEGGSAAIAGAASGAAAPVAAAGAGAVGTEAAAGAAVAGFAGPEFILAILLIFGIVGILVFSFTALNIKYPSSAAATETSGGNTSSLLTKACDFVKSVRSAGCEDKTSCPSEQLYNGVRQKSFDDCYGFVVTSAIETGIIPKSDESEAVSPRAKDAIDQYYSKHTDKYEIIGPVTSTKDLKPGDMLFNTRNGSHASLYTANKYCGCSSNALSASLGDHGPQCSSWYGDMEYAVRLKGTTP